MKPELPDSIDAAAIEYQRLKKYLCELADLPTDQREKAAGEMLADQPALLARVLKLLHGISEDEGFLELDLPGMLGLTDLDIAAQEPEKDSRLPGSSIGHYRIVERLGEGGMAVVYRARQTKPITREVALKVISAHVTSVQKMRFERECNTLARFSHPNVAVMYESGISPAGEPYLAMELVEGLTIAEWCRQHKTPIRQRINLFIEACQGLTHAHSKGILHRDIKPSNLLVTEVDGQPMVKVIDFGIAAALTPEVDDQANLTGRHLLSTPAYMSPESVYVSDQQALDARSDVYSLGVVLFELLCGKRPYDHFDLPLVDWIKILTTRAAPHMLQVFNRLPEAEKQSIASTAGCGSKNLSRLLASDLDVIVGKALQLDPERRYASSNELGEDLRRYLSGNAVKAHPPGRVYLTRRFLRRHWVSAGVVSVLLATLIGGIVARELEVRKTRLALQESSAISEFLVDLMEHASPLRLEGDEILLQDIIDTGTEQLSERFADQPAVHARLLHTLGRIYGERGDYQYGSDLMERSRQLMKTEAVDNPEELVRLLSDLGVALRRQGRMDEAQAVLLDGLARAKTLRPAQPVLEAALQNSVGNLYVLTEDFKRAEEHHSKALALRQAELPSGDILITSSKNNLASVLINSWQIERALPYAEQTLAEWQQSLPAGHPWISIARNNLAVVLERQGRKEESLQLMREAMADAQQRLGPNHPDVADLWRNISIDLRELGRRDEAKEAMQQHFNVFAASLGPDAPRTLAAERRLVSLGLFEKNFEQVLIGLNSIRQRLSQGGGNSSLEILLDLDRASALIGLKRFVEAKEVLNAIKGARGSIYLRMLRYQAIISGRTGNPSAAIIELLALQNLARKDLAEHDLSHGLILMELAKQGVAAGDYLQAVEWANESLRFWTLTFRTTPALQAHEILGQAYIALGKNIAGLEQLSLAVEGFRLSLPANHPVLLEAEATLAKNRALILD